MAKQTGYKSLTQLMDAELLPLTGCSDWDAAATEFDCVALVRDTVRSLEYKGSTYYITRPNTSKEELKGIIERHRKGQPKNVVSAPAVKTDIPHGTQCDRCVAPARVKAEFAAGPLYACQHHANAFGWWLESMAKEA